MTQADALALSLLLEVPCVLLLVRPAPGQRLRTAGIAAIATLLTHPFAWWGVQAGRPLLGFWGGVLVVEPLVVLAEGALYRAAGLAAPWRLALLANAVSFGVGLVIRGVVRGWFG